jgi:hypothetical protein
VRIQEGGGSCGAFEETPDTNKVPALAVTHSRISNALEEINILFHAVQESMWLRVPDLFHAGLLHLQEEAVELLPHLRADLFAYLPGIFARRFDAGHDG